MANIAIGETRTYRNRRGTRTYTVLRIDTVFWEHLQLDIPVIVWQGTCRVCGALFETTTGAREFALERGPTTVRCPEHRSGASPRPKPSPPMSASTAENSIDLWLDKLSEIVARETRLALEKSAENPS